MENEESGSISISDILYIIKKHLIIICALIFVGVVGGYVITKVVPPTYISTCSMMVSVNKESNTDTAAYQLSNYITDTYVVFISEDKVLDTVADNINEDAAIKEKELEYTAQKIRNNLKVTANSLVLSITYTDSDPEVARIILNEISEVACAVANEPDPTDPTKPHYRFLSDSLGVFSPAKDGKVQNHTVRNVAIGGCVGLVIAFIYVFCVEYFNKRFKDVKEVEALLGYTVLSEIIEYTDDQDAKKGQH